MTENNRHILMVANWKMNPHSPEAALEIFNTIKKSAKKAKQVQLVICPSAVHTGLLYKKTNTQVVLGAQGGDIEDVGAKTGLVSLEQYKKMGVQYVILGHSEERSRGQTSEQVSQQVLVSLKKGLIPIVCVGEEVRDTKGAYIFSVVKQLKESLANIPKQHISKVVIAYEPLWAIGVEAKRNATLLEVQELAILIRRTIADMYQMKKVPTNTIVYGGSVSDADFVSGAIKEAGIDGFLVGRASMSSQTFTPLLQAVSK